MTLVEVTIFALETIDAVVTAVKEAHAGKITYDQAHARIASMRGELRANDAAADAELAAKFSTEE